MIEKLFHLIAGIVLLTFGKRFFWLFVGCIGFVMGLNYAGAITGLAELWAIFLIAVFAGFVGVMMAIFLQGIAIGVAGFLAGGMVAWYFLNLLGFHAGDYFWIAHIAGGVIGLIMILLFFDWALIFFSSIIGAVFTVDAFAFSPPVRTLLFLVLSMVGVAFQTRTFKKTSL